MNIISKTKIWLSISGALVVASILALFIFGLKPGIDFTGGSLLEIEYKGERPPVSWVQEKLSSLELGNTSIQPVSEKGYILRLKEINEEVHQQALVNLSDIDVSSSEGEFDESEANAIGITADGREIPIKIEAVGAGEDNSAVQKFNSDILEQMRFESVGPSIGEELKRKSLYAMVIVLLVIIAYIAWSFRKVSKPVASWKYGLAAIVALFHDVLIVVGVFALLGRFSGVEIDTSFVAAILTVLGYSVNDTIVVFDRIRENLPRSEEDFAGTVNISLKQTIGRSINTSLTTLLVLLSILFFGGDTIKYFVLALVIGAVVGTYSSIFLASPLLVVWEKWQRK